MKSSTAIWNSMILYGRSLELIGIRGGRKKKRAGIPCCEMLKKVWNSESKIQNPEKNHSYAVLLKDRSEGKVQNFALDRFSTDGIFFF